MILFQAPIPNWPTAVVEIAKIVLPMLVTAVVSVWITRYTFKTKQAEIKGQAEIKAREILFAAYQKRLEASNNSAADLGAVMGELAKITDAKSEANLNGLILLFGTAMEFYRDELPRLEKDVAAAGLENQFADKLSFLKSALAIRLEEINKDNYKPVFWDFVKCCGIFKLINDELLIKRCEDLFRDFVK